MHEMFFCFVANCLCCNLALYFSLENFFKKSFLKFIFFYIQIDNKFKFLSHCWNQAAKAHNILGLMKNFLTSHQPKVIKKLHTAQFCPYLEFGMMVANLHFKCKPRNNTTKYSMSYVSTKNF